MSIEDLKIGSFNLGTLFLSFTNLESGLKVILLIATIVYTVQKIYYNHNENKKKV